MTRWRRLCRSTVFALLRFSGLPFLIRETLQRSRVTIVVYHAPRAAHADAHFAALRRRYNIVSLADFVEARSQPSSARLPPKALVITLDDGHKSNYGLTAVFAKHEIPVTIFLCSGIVGTRRHYWWSHTADAKEARALKGAPDEERVKFLLGNGHADTREYETREALSWEEVALMKSVVEFQSHTVFHPILPACSIERARREIVESKDFLEREQGLRVYALAYPNGDYSEREVELARNAGYSVGLTLDGGFNDSGTDAFRLRRVSVLDDASVNEVIVKTSGLWMCLKGFGAKACKPFGGRAASKSRWDVGSGSGARSTLSCGTVTEDSRPEWTWPGSRVTRCRSRVPRSGRPDR